MRGAGCRQEVLVEDARGGSPPPPARWNVGRQHGNTRAPARARSYSRFAVRGPHSSSSSSSSSSPRGRGGRESAKLFALRAARSANLGALVFAEPTLLLKGRRTSGFAWCRRSPRSGFALPRACQGNLGATQGNFGRRIPSGNHGPDPPGRCAGEGSSPIRLGHTLSRSLPPDIPPQR